MANRSIINIDVNDEQFQKFMELFREYEGKVKDSIDAWRNLDEAMLHMAPNMGKTVDSADRIASGLKDASKAQKDLHAQTSKSFIGMEKLSKSAKSVASSLFGIGKFMVKLGAGGIGLGLAGLWGLDKLANSAMNRQRESRGLGMTTGGPSAFRTNMQRYVDVDSVLSQTARIPYNAMIANYGNIMGLSASRIIGESNTKRALDVINKARENWLKDRSNPMAEVLPRTQAAERLGLDLSTLRRLGNTPKSELMGQEARIFQDSRAMRISDRTADEMSKLAIQMKRTGLVIETSLMRAVSSVAPQITHLTAEITTEFVKLLKSGELKMWILRLGQAAKYATEGIIWIGETLSAFSHPIDKTKEAGKDIGWWLNGRMFGTQAVKAYPPTPEEKRKMSVPTKNAPSSGPSSHEKLVKALTKHTQSMIRQKPNKITVDAPAGSRVSNSINGSAH